LKLDNDLNFKIGQKVYLSKETFGISKGIYVGSAEVQNKNGELEKLAIVRLDDRDHGFLVNKNNASVTKLLISTIVVQPKYLIFNN